MDDSGLLAPQRLTAEAVRAVTFPRAVGGFNAEAVTRFKLHAASELALAADERHELEKEIDRLSRENDALREQAVPVRVENQAVGILQHAQVQADNLVMGARQQAEHVVGSARQQHDRILADAQEKRGAMLRNAVDEAGRQAARIAAEAPVHAREQLARTQGLSQALQASLTAHIAAIQAQVDQWTAEDQALRREAVSSPPPGPVPA